MTYHPPTMPLKQVQFPTIQHLGSTAFSTQQKNLFLKVRSLSFKVIYTNLSKDQDNKTSVMPQ